MKYYISERGYLWKKDGKYWYWLTPSRKWLVDIFPEIAPSPYRRYKLKGIDLEAAFLYIMTWEGNEL